MKKKLLVLLVLPILIMFFQKNNIAKADSNPKIYKITKTNSNSIANINTANAINVYTKDFKGKNKTNALKKVMTGKQYHVTINGTKKIYQAIYKKRKLLGYVWHNFLNIDYNRTFSYQASKNFRKLINTYRNENGINKLKVSHKLNHEANLIAKNVDKNFLPKNTNNQMVYYTKYHETYMPTSFSYLAFKKFIYFDQNENNQSYNALKNINNKYIGLSAIKSPLHLGNHNEMNNYYLVVLIK
ncbi:hypothetical protein [Apilactobacillus timberlakei]|uniref:SCP domain-containing protein n=1 Tax=Apilactobacillus timberlakei TaxID=2008380 RepID=A0ABY2YWU2_9LACO|nr:hypothetical protein [Apilactobacillus timberlakei]TPR13143.1 hypothetical protein DYZ97_04450 [Apilactobacillus timberlakei]TPR14193.1 hypothetical protein DY048_04400 [Apilactobacillus timberlakei]TPR16446.1 hypothetical protein DY052_02490 [Apilactobacillus timberlakei]